MESAIVKAEKDPQKKENSQNSMCKDKALAGKTNSPNTLVKKVNPKHVLVFNITRSRNGECSIQESFFRHIRSLDRRIPRHIIGHEETYLKNCLEQIYISAAKSSSFSIPGMYGYSSHFYDTSSELKIRSRYAGDFTEIGNGFPSETEAGDVAVSPSRDWIVGSITGSKSITKILESPLFHQSARPKLISAMKTAASDSTSPPLSQKMGVLGNDRYRSELVDKRVASVSSTNSTLSDQSFTSSSAAVAQGMLHCTWTDGLPHYAFSLDDRKEVYVANAMKPESSNGKAGDYVYMFYSRAGERTEHDFNMNEFNLIGKMKVSTTSRLCPNDAEIKETEFVLFGVDEISQTSTSSHVVKKNKGLSKKMVEVFKAGHPSRERSSSKFAGTSAVFDNFTETPTLSDDHVSPNLELAAIVVKDHVCARREVAKVGGWGLKFLKKVDAKQDEIVDDPCPDCSLRSTSGCSTSMDVIVPAGFHGGPRNGGPCSLVDRWRSGGHCDCGGWDIGCPLTILDTKRTQNEVSLPENMEGHCRSLDLFVQGSTPVMKMVNIRDGLYFIHFHPRLSPLQCLSIAVANIHTQTPSLQSKLYRS